MKLITAIIKPFKLDDVREAISDIGIDGLTVTEVKLEIAVNDDQVDRLVEVITENARTGKIGDGKVFVYNLEQAVRIRTGEADSEAL